MMPRRIHAPLGFSLALLAIVIALLVAGGLTVQAIVALSIRDAQTIATARILVGDVLRGQSPAHAGRIDPSAGRRQSESPLA